MRAVSSYRYLSVQTDAGVATLTLERPDRLNALTRHLIDELLDAIRAVNEDDAVRAAVVTGSGRAFCAGIDLGGGDRTFTARPAGERASPPDGEQPARGAPDCKEYPATPPNTFVDISGPLALAVYRSHKPVIAAVNGAAVGVGATMTLPMDLRLASTEARFAFPFTRRGISPDACSSWFLPRVVGISRALQWSLGGGSISAEEALAGGLVHSLHPPGELMAAAHDMAHALCANGAPVSIAVTRRLMWRMLGENDPAGAHELESRLLGSRGGSGDAREGVRAFVQKRQPAFPDLVSRDVPDWFRRWDAP